MKPRTLGLATIVGLLGTAIGIVAPILWDQYKSKTAVELRQISNSVVVSKSQELEKLQFVYGGNSVPSLSRIELQLTNTGRTPIRQSDIVTPLVIRVKDARILDSRITKVTPNNLEVVQALTPNQDALEMRFQLLNPDDSVFVTLLAATDRAELSAAARIAGLEAVSYVVLPWYKLAQF